MVSAMLTRLFTIRSRCPSRRPFARFAWLVVSVLLPAISAATDGGHVGGARCAECHADAAAAWRGSHHDLAMAGADEQSVLGDFTDSAFTAHGVTSRFFRRDGRFLVRTDGPDGELHDYPVRYTFGWYPLQQYLVEFPGGRLQALGIAWDSRPLDQGGQRWFHLYPDTPMDHTDSLHWTGREQTWNYQCAECHSTDLRKGYDLETDSYHTTWREIDVACEACHGPGGKHVEWAGRQAAGAQGDDDPTMGLVIDLSAGGADAWHTDPASGAIQRLAKASGEAQLTTCARCHARRGTIGSDYRHGQPLGDTHRLALLDEHLYFADGQIRDEVYVYGSFIQSRMHHAGVVCTDCHEPHSLKLRAAGNALCTRCHLAERYDAPDHHHHADGSSGAACTACHMPQRTYMVIDQRADHSLRVPRPDLSVALGTPNACSACHADKDAGWAAAAVADWYPDSRYRGDHFAHALSAAAQAGPDAGERLAAVAADPAQSAIARATALQRLQAHASAAQLPLVEKLLGDDDALVRAAAVRFLAVTDVRTRVDLGWPLLDDPVRTVRTDAAQVLASLLRQRVPQRFRDQLEAAVAEYIETQYANAERPESHLNVGLVQAAAGDSAAAESAYRTALRLDARFAPAYVNLADLYRQTGRDDESERLLRGAIEALPRNPDLHYALGLRLVRDQRLAEALVYLQQASEWAPEQPRYALVYALGLQQAGEKDHAARVLRAALAGHPGDAELQAALDGLD